MIFYVAGTVEINGVGVARNMVVVSDDPAGGTVLARGVSDVNGAFDISYRDWSGPVITFALDNYGNAWTAEEDLLVGDLIHPTTPNGFVYEVTTAGITGTAEPTWPISGTVNDGSVTFAPVEFYRPIASGSLVGAEWSPSNLYTNGERGVWYEMEPEYLYQDEAGTVPVVSAGDPVFRGNDLSPNAIPFYAPTSSARPVWQSSESLLFDKADDKITIDLGTIAFIGTVWIKTPNGILHYEVDTTGVWGIPVRTTALHDNNLGPLITVEGSVTDPKVITYMGSDSKFAGVTSMSRWFWDRTEVTKIFCNNWEISSVTNFSSFANNCNSLTVLDVSSWDVSNVAHFNFFATETKLTTLDVSNWDVSKVTNFSYFMHKNYDLTELDVSTWNTISAVDISNFADNCSSLTTLDVSNWNTSNVTNARSFIASCRILTTLDVSNWDTSKFTDVGGFAYFCTELITLDVSNWNTINIKTFINFAYFCQYLTVLDVTNWNTDNAEAFSGFIRSSGILALNLSNWNTSKVTNFSIFANNATNLSTVTVNGGTGNPFSDSLCTNYSSAFTNTNLTQQSIDDILVAIEQAGTSTGTFDQSGGSAPSAVGNAAIDALRARGWTITVTGAY